MTLGFTLMYASLALKMYRIHVLFNNKYMKVVTMGVRQMLFILGLILLAELLVLLLFVFVDELEAGYVLETVKGALIPYYECQSSTGSPPRVTSLIETSPFSINASCNTGSPCHVS